jgi:hypothetical protein
MAGITLEHTRSMFMRAYMCSHAHPPRHMSAPHTYQNGSNHMTLIRNRRVQDTCHQSKPPGPTIPSIATRVTSRTVRLHSQSVNNLTLPPHYFFPICFYKFPICFYTFINSQGESLETKMKHQNTDTAQPP